MASPPPLSKVLPVSDLIPPGLIPACSISGHRAHAGTSLHLTCLPASKYRRAPAAATLPAGGLGT